MYRSNILRVRRTDAIDSHLLVHVTQEGPMPLDLKLIGTEHTELFHGEIKDSQIKSLQSSNYGGTLQEWNSILLYALLSGRDSSNDTTDNGSSANTSKAKAKKNPQDDDSSGNNKNDDDEDLFNNLDIVAAIKSSTLTLTLRKSLPGGIVQRLGSLNLIEDTNREAISPFDWVDEAVSRSDSLRTQLEAQRTELIAARAETKKLNGRLDELVAAKKEFERDLLEKCAALINAKKLKIRDQQRLLMAAKLDDGVAREVAKGRGGNGKEKVKKEDETQEGVGKRRKVEADEDEGDDTDAGDAEGRDEGQQEETPPPSVGEGTDDSDDDGFAAPPAGIVKESREASTVKATSQGPSESEKMDVNDPEDLPPKRKLPFGRPPSEQPESSSAAGPSKDAEPAEQEDEDDDTDDEL